MLEIRNVSKIFNPGTVNEKTALDGIDLTLNEGDFVTVIGGNGAGKSTMLNMVAGVYPVDGGRISIDGVDVTRLPEYTIFVLSANAASSATTSSDFSTFVDSPVSELSFTCKE